MCNSRESANSIRTRILRLANYEHLYRSKLAHVDADLRSDQLLGDPLLQHRSSVFKAHAGDSDSTQLRETDCSVPLNDEGIASTKRAHELNFEGVSRPHYIVRGNRDVRQRSKRIGRQIE